MNHSEKTKYHNDSTEYLRQSQVREIFQKAILELTLKQPEDPVDFLIRYFGQRRKFQVFSVIGMPDDKIKRMTDNIANEHNFMLLQAEGSSGSDLAVRDSNDYSKMLKGVETLERNFDGVLFYNFPVTKNQLESLKRHKVMFTRMFYMRPRKPQLTDQINTVYYNNLESIAESLKDITTVVDEDDFAEFPMKVANLVKLQHKRLTPKRPPRVLVYHHPARSEMSRYIRDAAHYYDLPVISLEKTLTEQRDKLKSLGCISHEVLVRRAQIPDDICSAFMQHELNKTVCLTKGFVMVNYPMDKAQINQFLKMKIDPVMILYLDETPEKRSQLMEDLEIDAQNGRLFSAFDKVAKDEALGLNHQIVRLTEDQKKSVLADATFFEKAMTEFPYEWRSKVRKLSGEETAHTSGQNLIEAIYQLLNDETIYP